MTRRAHIVGWVMFVLSACGFIASSLRSGDMLELAGSVLFFLACFVFLIPLVRTRPPDRPPL